MMWRVGCSAGQVTAKRCRYEGVPVVEDEVTRATGLRAGEVDFANYVPREHVERLSQAPETTVLRRRDSQRVASYFNLSKRPFYGAQGRRAILGYGIDRQAIVRTALLGRAQAL